MILLAVTAAPALAQNMVRAKCDRFTMNVPSQNVRCYQVDSNIPVPEEASPEQVKTAQVANTAFLFSDYQNFAGSIPPQVTFYKIDDMGRTAFDLLDISMAASDMMDNLNSGYADLSEIYQDTPFMPYQTEERRIFAMPERLDFTGGSGVRTLAGFQDTISANAGGSNIYYSFQGISNDGTYYISAVFPIQSQSLQGQMAGNVDWNTVTGDDFIPSLTELDYYVRSIVIE